MDAGTFEVLAMTNWPFFDPNIIPEKKTRKMNSGATMPYPTPSSPARPSRYS